MENTSHNERNKPKIFQKSFFIAILSFRMAIGFEPAISRIWAKTLPLYYPDTHSNYFKNFSIQTTKTHFFLILEETTQVVKRVPSRVKSSILNKPLTELWRKKGGSEKLKKLPRRCKTGTRKTQIIQPKKLENFREKPDLFPERTEHLFKKLLVACCDSCERRASVHHISSCDEEGHSDENKEETHDEEDEENQCEEEAPPAFECPEENKAEVHDVSEIRNYSTVVVFLGSSKYVL